MNAKKPFPKKRFYLTCFLTGLTAGGIIVDWYWLAVVTWLSAVVSGFWFFMGLNRTPEHRRLRNIFLPVLLMTALTMFITVNEVRGEQRPGGDNQEEFFAMLCVGLVVVIVGAIIIVSLKKMCDKINPPKKKETPPENPPATNAPPYYAGPITITADSGPVAPRFEFDDTAASFWDISDYSATNGALKDPMNNPYTLEFIYNFRTSTNLITWTTNSIHGYVSSAFIHVTAGTNSMLVPRQYRPMIEVQSGGTAGFFQPLP